MTTRRAIAFVFAGLASVAILVSLCGMGYVAMGNSIIRNVAGMIILAVLIGAAASHLPGDKMR